jgi:hypothetical protein
MIGGDETVARHGQSIVLPPGQGRVIALGDVAQVTLKAVLPPATAGPPLHLHRNWDEAFYVL